MCRRNSSALISKALRKDREQRYQVMKDLQLDLQALRDEVAGQTRAATPDGVQRPTSGDAHAHRPAATGATPRSQSSAEYVVTGLARHKVSAALVACVLAVIVGGAWWAVRNRHAGGEPRPNLGARPAKPDASDVRVRPADGCHLVAGRTAPSRTPPTRRATSTSGCSL